MIRRIYYKVIYFLDVFFAAIYKQFEKKGWLNEIDFSEIGNKKDVLSISHPYPVNFSDNDKLLFDEWKTYQTFENKIFIVNNCSVSNNGVVFKGFQNFKQALPHPFFKTEFGFLFLLKQKLFYKKVEINPDRNYLLIYDFWSKNNYYHWIIDSMCRLMKWKHELNSYTLLIPKNTPKYITDTLALFEFKGIEYIEKRSYVTVKTLAIPNYCAWSGQQHPAVLKQVKELLLLGFPESVNNERIYVSRGKQKHRKISNEKEVFSVLQKYNFKVIYFEGMTVAQQISAVRNAKCFVTSHGANVTNAIFGTDIKVLELLRKDKPNFCYWSTLSALEIPYYYQLCDIVNHDDLYVDIILFEKNLKLVLGE